MSKELAVINQQDLIQTYQDIEVIAKAMVSSGYFADSKSVSQAVVKILAGREIGFGPFASMNGVRIIKGNPTLSGNMLATLVKRSGRYNYKVKRLDGEACEIEFYESGQPAGISAFTLKDAKAAGLLGKEVWTQYTRNLLFARAMSNGVKWYCPDVTTGSTVYTPEELDYVSGSEYSDDGIEIIDGEAEDVDVEEKEPDENDKEMTSGEEERAEILEELGFGSNEVEMTLERANKIKGSDGIPYGDCTDEELKGKLFGIVKKLNDKGTEVTYRKALDTKRKAAMMILEARAKGK